MNVSYKGLDAIRLILKTIHSQPVLNGITMKLPLGVRCQLNVSSERSMVHGTCQGFQPVIDKVSSYSVRERDVLKSHTHTQNM